MTAQNMSARRERLVWWSAALLPAPVLDFAHQRGDLLHSRLEHLARWILGHAAAGFRIARRGRKAGVAVECHQVRAPEVLGGQKIGEPPELMVAGREGNALSGKDGLEQFLRRLLQRESAVSRMNDKKPAGDEQIFLRQRNEACDRRLHAARSNLRQRRSR